MFILLIKSFLYSISPVLVCIEFYSIYTKDLIFHMNPSSGDQDNDVEDSSEVDYFNSIIKARDKLIKLFEEHNKKYNQSKSHQDKMLMDKYGEKLDSKEKEIEKFKEKGYLDPSDFPGSAEGSDEE